MKTVSTSTVKVRRRLRRTAEVLVDDSGLRSNLTDTQAKQLLDWGLAHVQATAAQTADLSDDDAYPIIEDTVSGVREVMRLVNRLQATTALMPGETVTGQMSRLLEALQKITGQAPDPAFLERAEKFSRDRPGPDNDTTFQLLLGLLPVTGSHAPGEESG